MMSCSKNSLWSRGLRYKLACAYIKYSKQSAYMHSLISFFSFTPEEMLDSWQPKEPILKTDQTAQMLRLI